MSDYGLNKYATPEVSEAISTNMESTRARLMRQKKGLEDRLADVNHALDLLEKNPLLEEFQDVMRRI